MTRFFLREARHILKDPLHPQAFDLVWTFDVWARASKLLPGETAAAYPLVPVVLAPNKEVAGHIEQVLFIWALLYATALTAIRLGLDSRKARWAALMVADSPAVLGIASTVMADIAAATFGILGMERFLAWRDERRWHQAAAAVFAVDGINPGQLWTVRTRLWRFAPLRTRNTLAFFCHRVLVTPIAIPWLFLRRIRVSWPLVMAGATAAGATPALPPTWGTGETNRFEVWKIE